MTSPVQDLAANAAIARRPLKDVLTEPVEPFIHRVIGLLAAWVRRRMDLDWRGRENVPAGGGALIVMNHISYFDIVTFGHFLAWAGRYPRFLAKAELFDAPVLGWVLRRCGQIRVDRGTSAAAAAVSAAVAGIEAGRVVSIYPEGTITADPDRWPMTVYSGAARIALLSGAPVVPVAQWGAQQVMPGRRAGWPRFRPRPTSQVWAGPPIDLDDLRDRPLDRAVLAEASARILDALTRQLSVLRGEPAPDQHWDQPTGHRVDGAVRGQRPDPNSEEETPR